MTECGNICLLRRNGMIRESSLCFRAYALQRGHKYLKGDTIIRLSTAFLLTPTDQLWEDFVSPSLRIKLIRSCEEQTKQQGGRRAKLHEIFRCRVYTFVGVDPDLGNSIRIKRLIAISGNFSVSLCAFRPVD